MDEVCEVWAAIIGLDESSIDITPGEAQQPNNIFERLINKLQGCMGEGGYEKDTHGVQLEGLATRDGMKLSFGVFVDWYIRWVYENELFSD